MAKVKNLKLRFQVVANSQKQLLILGYPALNDDGFPMIVTDRFALYPYTKETYQMVTFKDDGSEIGAIKTKSQAKRILTMGKVPDVVKQREYALKYKLILE